MNKLCVWKNSVMIFSCSHLTFNFKTTFLYLLVFIFLLRRPGQNTKKIHNPYVYSILTNNTIIVKITISSPSDNLKNAPYYWHIFAWCLFSTWFRNHRMIFTFFSRDITWTKLWNKLDCIDPSRRKTLVKLVAGSWNFKILVRNWLSACTEWKNIQEQQTT